jgi:hypothetical protein
MGNVTSKLIEAYAEVNEKKKLDPVGQADADIDNDGDVDKSDKYLHNRRKAIKKAMDESKVECPKCDGEGCDHCDGKGYHMKEGYESVAKEMKKMHDEGYGKKAIMAKYNHMDNATLEKLYASSCGTREEVEESSKAALAKKLAKASAPSEKGKKAVTLKKAPWEKNEANNDEEVIMNPKKEKDKKDGGETMANESKRVDEISDKMKDRYVQRSVADYGHSNAVRKDAESRGDKDLAVKMKSRMKKRNQGMTRAFGGQNENVLPPVYARILEERAKHYKGATPPEGMMDNSKSSKGAMDMVNQPKEINDDDEKGHEDASKAGRVGPSAKARPADNMKGDKKVIPSATPMKGK